MAPTSRKRAGRVTRALARATRTDPLLERLAEGVEHVGVELGHLVEEEDAAVAIEISPGCMRGAAAADHGHRRGAVVGGPERRPADQPARAAAPRPAAEWTRVASSAVGQVEVGQQADQPLGQHGLARARAARS